MSATSESTIDHPRGLGAIAGLRHKWGWFVALGVLMIVVGVIALANLFLATVVSVLYVGAMMFVGGIFEIVHAFGVKSWGKFFWWLISGIVYAAGGVIAFMNPLLASSVLTLLLAATLVATGVIHIWVGFQHRAEANWGWIVAAGIVTALAGLIIAIGWPVNSLFILGIFLGIDLIFQGVALTGFGLSLRRG